MFCNFEQKWNRAPLCQLKNYKKTPKKLIQVFQHVNYSQGGKLCENKYLKHKIRMKHLKVDTGVVDSIQSQNASECLDLKKEILMGLFVWLIASPQQE